MMDRSEGAPERHQWLWVTLGIMALFVLFNVVSILVPNADKPRWDQANAALTRSYSRKLIVDEMYADTAFSRTADYCIVVSENAWDPLSEETRAGFAASVEPILNAAFRGSRIRAVRIHVFYDSYEEIAGKCDADSPDLSAPATASIP